MVGGARLGVTEDAAGETGAAGVEDTRGAGWVIGGTLAAFDAKLLQPVRTSSKLIRMISKTSFKERSINGLTDLLMIN